MRHRQIRDMVFASIMMALIVFLSVTMLGYIFYAQGTAPITIIHIPVVVGAIVLGKRYGALLGATFGLFSMIMAFIYPTIINAPFTNPILSVLPRAIFGFIIYPIYLLIDKYIKNRTASTALSIAISTLIHSIIVIILLYFTIKTNLYFYADDYKAAFESVTLKSILMILISFNSLIEIVIAVLVGTPAALILINLRNKYNEESNNQPL
jgi:uncharacterized membrane protein